MVGSKHFISAGRRHCRQFMVDVGFSEVGLAYWNSALSSIAGVASALCESGQSSYTNHMHIPNRHIKVSAGEVILNLAFKGDRG